MSNSFNISLAPEIAAVSALITTVDTVVDLIRGTDVPNIQTNIDANETKIDTINGIVDAIKLKTDLIPQTVRGHITTAFYGDVTDVYADVCNITGQGKIYFASIKTGNAGDTVMAKLTLDSNVFIEISHTGDAVIQYIFPQTDDINSANLGLSKIPDTGQFPPLFNLSFDTSLLFEVKRSAGATGAIFAKILYIVDSF